MATTTETPFLTLNTGTSIPQIGFGTYQIEPEDTYQAVTTALEAGYRSIDTAQMYGNEAEVGQAIRESGISRNDIFLTTKLDNYHHGSQAAIKAFHKSLSRFDLEMIDLFLIHWPRPNDDRYVETWNALIDLHEQGLIGAIGVSNFQIPHLDRLREETSVIPAVNQIELHPTFHQGALRTYHQEHGILTEAWSPLGQGGDILEDDTITAIATAHDADAGQIILAWHRQLGNIAIPKSTTPSRIKSNLQSLDIELTEDEIHQITELGDDGRMGPNPDEFEG